MTWLHGCISTRARNRPTGIPSPSAFSLSLIFVLSLSLPLSLTCRTSTHVYPGSLLGPRGTLRISLHQPPPQQFGLTAHSPLVGIRCVPGFFHAPLLLLFRHPPNDLLAASTLPNFGNQAMHVPLLQRDMSRSPAYAKVDGERLRAIDVQQPSTIPTQPSVARALPRFEIVKDNLVPTCTTLRVLHGVLRAFGPKWRESGTYLARACIPDAATFTSTYDKESQGYRLGTHVIGADAVVFSYCIGVRIN